MSFWISRIVHWNSFYDEIEFNIPENEEKQFEHFKLVKYLIALVHLLSCSLSISLSLSLILALRIPQFCKFKIISTFFSIYKNLWKQDFSYC